MSLIHSCPPIALVFSALARSVSILFFPMKHVAAPLADQFIDMLYGSSITNHKAASEHWTGCNVEKQSGASQSYTGCVVGGSVESDSATFQKMSTVICDNIHRGGPFLLLWVILVFRVARLKKQNGACDVMCLCFHLTCAAECDKDDTREISQIFGTQASWVCQLHPKWTVSHVQPCMESTEHCPQPVSHKSGSAGDCAIAVLQYVALNTLSWTSASVFLTLSPYINSQMWPP